jgi:hypothetical protein
MVLSRLRTQIKLLPQTAILRTFPLGIFVLLDDLDTFRCSDVLGCWRTAYIECKDSPRFAKLVEYKQIDLNMLAATNSRQL